MAFLAFGGIIEISNVANRPVVGLEICRLIE